MPSICVFASHPALATQAENLANQLQLPLINDLASAKDYVLLVTENYLALQPANARTAPLYIDFLSKQTTYRRQRATIRRETLARALGLKNTIKSSIIDATAGLARDSFILAALGFEITLLERSPLINVLLNDALQRARLNPGVAPIINRMRLIETDAATWLQQLPAENRPDVIYLDPMYPETGNTALPKKDMQIFHDVIGADSDSSKLLPIALTCAIKRVVVKRPRLAENLAAIPPSFSQEGSSSRFDIYLL